MIYLGADHRGYELKEKIKGWFRSWGYDFEDLGNTRFDPEDDYPDFACLVAKKLKKEEDFGIVICGSGVGMDIVVNRFGNVRSGLGFSGHQVRLARRDDNINCLALAADFIPEEEVKIIIQMFLETKFSGKEKYLKRIKKINKV